MHIQTVASTGHVFLKLVPGVIQLNVEPATATMTRTQQTALSNCTAGEQFSLGPCSSLAASNNIIPITNGIVMPTRWGEQVGTNSCSDYSTSSRPEDHAHSRQWAGVRDTATNFSLAAACHATAATPESRRTCFRRETPATQRGKHPLWEPPALYFPEHLPDRNSPCQRSQCLPSLHQTGFLYHCEFGSHQSNDGNEFRVSAIILSSLHASCSGASLRWPPLPAPHRCNGRQHHEQHDFLAERHRPSLPFLHTPLAQPALRKDRQHCRQRRVHSGLSLRLSRERPRCLGRPYQRRRNDRQHRGSKTVQSGSSLQTIWGLQ